MRVAAVLWSAVFYALAFPPFDFGLVAWIALVPFFLALRSARSVEAFYLGCLFGYAFGWSTMWALAEAAGRYFQIPMAGAVLGVGAYYLIIAGVPCGVFAYATRLVWRRSSATAAGLVIPCVWVAAELVRARVFEQPWVLFGYSQHEHIPLLQIASWTGVYGVSYVLVMANAGLAAALCTRDLAAAVRALVVPAIAIGLCWGLGARASVDGHLNQPTSTVAIVQTNISPSARWTRPYVSAQLSAHLRQTEQIGANQHPSLIVWPESAVPRYLEAEPGLARMLGDVARRHRADLLFGVPRYENGHSYNSVRLINADGRSGGYYDKQRLVPLAEERPTLFSRRESSNDVEAFVPGSRSPVLQSFVPIGVSVCHEIIHPDVVDVAAGQGAQLLVNVANDGWVGTLAIGAAEQHLTMATFRAIETHRYLVRAAITGVSAVVDPFGRVVDALPAGQSGVLLAGVRPETAVTPYVRYGDVFAMMCLLTGGVAIAILGGVVRRIRAVLGAPSARPGLALR